MKTDKPVERCEDREDAIATWIAHEIEPWKTVRGWDDVEQSFSQLVSHADSVYQFRIDDGKVSFVEKNLEWSEPTHPAHAHWLALSYRANRYRFFFEAVVKAFHVAGQASFAVDLDDIETVRSTAPVLAFQKKRGSHRILIPDIDFIESDFYISADLIDHISFVSKEDRAIFVGSTTGMLNISRHDIVVGSHRRIRSAQYFRGSQDVVFELPNIVQCDGPDTEAFIRSLKFSERIRQWSEQFGFRYILSLDGNGATCSRVVIALGSNSVLLKYDSQNILFYFQGLVAWRHFVPICDDIDVHPAITFVRARPGLASEIAAEATRFRDRYLSRIALMTYTAELLRQYIAVFGTSHLSRADALPLAKFLIDASGWFTDGRNYWSAPGEWLQHEQSFPLLGVRLYPGPRFSDALQWTTHHADGFSMSLRSDEMASGMRGHDSPVVGISIFLLGGDQGHITLSYEARFADGVRIGPFAEGSLCRAPSNAPMTALRLVTTTG